MGAYSLATGVAAPRVINRKHWQGDVVARAGFGTLPAYRGYLTPATAGAGNPGCPKA